jgi:hypothetical protein
MATIEAKSSRRAFLQASALTVTAMGLSSTRNLFAETGAAITPFRYVARQAALDDLRQRLARARWPERETVADWSQGVPLAKLRALVEYWRTKRQRQVGVWQGGQVGLGDVRFFRAGKCKGRRKECSNPHRMVSV